MTEFPTPPVFGATSVDLYHPVRAKYFIMPDGTARLSCVQYLSTCKFHPEGWELREDPNAKSKRVFDELDRLNEDEEGSPDDEKIGLPVRAIRRARLRAFDYIMCNPDLDTFCTFTYAPERVSDRYDYGACYDLLRPWLSNRVQRAGLKYVICYEKHPTSGALHFHALMNSSALKLVRARYPKSGRAISRQGKPLYNISDWPFGFTTAQIIGEAEDDHTKVSKYIYKYMGKGQCKIGGRYFLAGGDLREPVYFYGDKPEDFFPEGVQPKHTKMVRLCDGAVEYVEYSFI